MRKKHLTTLLTVIGMIIFYVPLYGQKDYKSEVTDILEAVDEIPNGEMAAKDSLLKMASSIAQVHCSDSINAAIYLRMGYNFKNKSLPDSAAFYLNTALQIIPEEDRMFSIKSAVFQSYSDLKNSLGEKDSVEIYLKKAIDYSKAAGDSALIIGNFADLARLYSNTNRNKEAINLLEIIEEYHLRNQDYFYLKHIYNQLGVCYFRINAAEAAKETLHKALALEVKEGEIIDMHCYNNLGQMHSVLLNDQDSAIYYYKKSSFLAEKYNYTYSWLVSMLNQGNCYEALEQYSKAEKIYLKVLRSDYISSYFIIETAATINLGIIYYKIQQFQNSSFFIQEGLRMAREGKYLDFEINALKYKTLLSALKGENTAFESEFNMLYNLVDSSYKLSHNNEVSELKVKYETEKGAQENLNLKAQDELNQEIIEKQRIMLWVMISGIMILLFLLMFIYNLNKKQKRLTKSLHESNITKDKLFSVIGHDLKSPMSSILTTLTMLDVDNFDLDESQFRNIVKELKLNVENSTMLLSNILQWSQNQMNGITNNPQHTHLKQETEKVHQILRNKIQQKALNVSFNIDDKLCVWCDPQLFYNAILNLFNNAIKFTNPNGNIAIDAKIQDKMIQVCVTDNGVGIPLEYQDKLFHIETGYHTDGTANEKGTGLGLAMCKEYVDAMGGEISVKSEPGKGSTFCFTIPAMKNA